MAHLQYKQIGSIELHGTCFITDPCYSTDAWCQEYLNKIAIGTYNCFYSVGEIKGWGPRVSAIKILLNGLENSESSLKRRVLSYNIGVDSGQAGIFEGHYYEVNQPQKEWYEKVCRITLDKPCVGIIDNKGIVAESGIGDGLYTLYGYFNKERDLVGLLLVFL